MAKNTLIDDSTKDVGEQLDLWDAWVEGNPDAAGFVTTNKVDAKRGRGRPSGAMNKRTLMLMSFLTSNYKNPIVGLHDIISKKPVDLLKDIGMKVEGLDIAEYNKWIWTAFMVQMRLAETVGEKYWFTPLKPDAAPNGANVVQPMQVNIDLRSKDVSVCSHTPDIDAKSEGKAREASGILDIYNALSDKN